MNLTITIPDSALPAYQAVVDNYNAGSGQSPVDLTGYLQILQDERTERHVAAHESTLRALMTPIADEIIAAAGGDPVKVQTAALAGKTAALAAIA